VDCGSHHRHWLKSEHGAEETLVEALWEEVVSMCLETTPKLGAVSIAYMRMEEDLVGFLPFLAFEVGLVVKVASSNDRHLKSFL
jgi:hypothetical protein